MVPTILAYLLVHLLKTSSDWTNTNLCYKLQAHKLPERALCLSSFFDDACNPFGWSRLFLSLLKAVNSELTPPVCEGVSTKWPLYCLYKTHHIHVIHISQKWPVKSRSCINSTVSTFWRWNNLNCTTGSLEQTIFISSLSGSKVNIFRFILPETHEVSRA